MENDLVAEAKNVWERFAVEMTAWEREANAAIRGGIDAGLPESEMALIDAAFRDRLTEIFDRYGIVSARNRNRILALECRDPPSYDLKTLIVESIEHTGSTVAIVARQTVGLQTTNRFTLKSKGHQIVLSKKETLRFTGKWDAVGF